MNTKLHEEITTLLDSTSHLDKGLNLPGHLETTIGLHTLLTSMHERALSDEERSNVPQLMIQAKEAASGVFLHLGNRVPAKLTQKARELVRQTTDVAAELLQRNDITDEKALRELAAMRTFTERMGEASETSDDILPR